MLRAVLLGLARQGRLRRWMETSPAARRLTRRFVAGETLEDGMRVVEELAGRGMAAALDHLGENVTREEEAAGAAAEVGRAIGRIRAAGAGATVAVKLTQFGLDLGGDVCLRHLEPVVRAAGEVGTRVEIDMESSAYTERTLGVVREMHAAHGCVRAVVQAYLYRTGRDVADLNREGVPVRLCKGAYREPEAVAYPAKREVDAAYRRLMERLLKEGTEPALATHDEALLEQARRWIDGWGVRGVEFQMLYGIRREWQARLAGEGRRVRIYVPYGGAWYPYFMRRLAERPANLWFLAGNLLHK